MAESVKGRGRVAENEDRDLQRLATIGQCRRTKWCAIIDQFMRDR